MTYFLRAWVKDGRVVMCHTSAFPITQDRASVDSPDAIVTAEVAGEYRNAGSVRVALSWDGEALSGLDFVTQEAVTPRVKE